MRDRAWTLILWDIENVPIPDQLRNPVGVKKLKELLKHSFGKSRQHQLHCMKLACRWPDYRSPYADLLGLLTTLGDVEALGYQWQGQRDKTHNADRLLKQAADRFMHMLEDHNGPEHIVVFITSDQDFGEKIMELQRRNFKVVVLYHEPIASQRPVSIINAADEAHAWLPFLRHELNTPQLSISSYDANAYFPGKSSPPEAVPSSSTQAPSGRQNVLPERVVVKAQPPPPPFIHLVPAKPISVQAVTASKQQPFPAKVSSSQKASPPKQPSVAAQILSIHRAAEPKQTSTKAEVFSNQAANMPKPQPVTKKAVSVAAATPPEQVIAPSSQAVNVDQACALLLQAIHKSDPAKNDDLLSTVTEACLKQGLRKISGIQLQLSPVSCSQIGIFIKQQKIKLTGKLQANLQSDALSPYLDIIAGPKGVQPAILPKLAELIHTKHRPAQLKDVLQISFTHPHNSGATSANVGDGKVFITISGQDQAQTPVSQAEQSVHAKHPMTLQADQQISPIISDQIQTLVEAVEASRSTDDAQLICTVAKYCLVNGHDHSIKTHLQLLPVSCADIGLEVKHLLPDQSGKLITQLQAEACMPYFKLVFGRKGNHPEVTPVLSALIRKKYKSAAVRKVLAAMTVSQTHSELVSPASGADGHIFLSCSTQDKVDASINAKLDAGKKPGDVLVSLVQSMTLSHVAEPYREIIKAVTNICLAYGMQSSKKQSQLWPTPMCHLDSQPSTAQWAGSMQDMLQDAAYEAYFQLLPGRSDVAVLPKLSAMFPVCSPAFASLLTKINIVDQRTDASCS